MKHLFIARHGRYNICDDSLNNSGLEQMNLLAENIRGILNGDSAYVISSTAKRAMQSSMILVNRLGLPEPEGIPYIWSGSDSPAESYYWDLDTEKLMAIVDERKDKADGLIMMTHLEVAEAFPTYFLNKRLGIDEYIEEIAKGQAVYFDLEKKSYEILPR